MTIESQIKTQPQDQPLEVAPEPIADISTPSPEPVAEPNVSPEPSSEHHAKSKPAPRTPFDTARAEIAARFSKGRSGEEPSPEAAPPEPVLEPTSPEPQPEPRQTEPPKFRVKVNHEERELTQDELIAAAQKGLAGDDYLAQAKQLLEETKRTVSSRPNQDASRSAPAVDPVEEPTDDRPNQGDPVKELIETIQYGDPDQARELFDRTVTSQVTKVLTADRINTDRAADVRAFNDFKRENPDLLADEASEAAAVAFMAKAYRDDLLNVGVPTDALPRDVQQLADLHRQFKLNGAGVRPVPKILADVKEQFVTWRGGPKPNAGTVAVDVDRTSRRATIPHQPTRAAAPPAPSAQRQNAEPNRSAIVQQIRRSRGQIV
jgi:hypothetical protein